MKQLRSIKFIDYSNHNCVNEAYHELVQRFLSVINFLTPIRAIRAKSNSKNLFSIHVLDAIQNCDKYYKKFKQSGKEIGKGNFKSAKP